MREKRGPQGPGAKAPAAPPSEHPSPPQLPAAAQAPPGGASLRNAVLGFRATSKSPPCSHVHLTITSQAVHLWVLQFSQYFPIKNFLKCPQQDGEVCVMAVCFTTHTARSAQKERTGLSLYQKILGQCQGSQKPSPTAGGPAPRQARAPPPQSENTGDPDGAGLPWESAGASV